MVEKSNQYTYIKDNLIRPNRKKKKGHVQEARVNAINCVQALITGLRCAVFVLGQPDIPITEPTLQPKPGNNSKVLLWLLAIITLS